MKEENAGAEFWEEIRKTNRQMESLIKLCIPSEKRKNEALDLTVLRKWMQLLIDSPMIRKYAGEVKGDEFEETIRQGIKRMLYDKWRKSVKCENLERFIEAFDPLICAELKLAPPQTEWIRRHIRGITPWHPVDDFGLMAVDQTITFSLAVEKAWEALANELNADSNRDKGLTHLFIGDKADTYTAHQRTRRMGAKIIVDDWYWWYSKFDSTFLRGFGEYHSYLPRDIINIAEMFLTGMDIGLSAELMKLGNYPIGFTWDQQRLVVMCAEEK